MAHIREQAAEIERLRSQLSIARSQQPLLSVLRELAIDPTVPPHVRLKAAEAGVQYETPKLSATWGIVTPGGGIGDRMDAAQRVEAAKRRLAALDLKVIDGEASADNLSAE
jgi:hypothetical protein